MKEFMNGGVARTNNLTSPLEHEIIRSPRHLEKVKNGVDVNAH